jgi:hypothetical protein
MFLGIQLVGLVFVAVMVYFTYLNYKRHNYGSRSFISWLVIWLVTGVVVLLPSSLYNFMDFLNIERLQDLFFVGAFAVLFVVVFNMYVTIKQTKGRIEELVRADAMRNPVRKSRKN